MNEFLRPLGNTGIQVSAIGLGTVKIGRNEGVKYPQGFSIPDDDAVTRLLDSARDLEINVIDTAPAYGTSETRLGNLLRHRQDWVIVSKTGEEFENGHSAFDFTPEHTRYSVQRSLQRLKTDYIDVVLIHSDGNDMDIIHQFGTLEALDELKKEGMIRAYGLSGKTCQGGLTALQRSDVAMVTSNLRYNDEQAVIDYAAQHSKGVFIKKALASGHLDGVDGDAVQLSFDKLLHTEGVSSLIIGTINPTHLKENLIKARKSLSW